MILLQAAVSGLLLGAVYALFSSGLTLIWGMMNFINFAHGEFVMLGMYVALVVTWGHFGPEVFGPAAAVVLFCLGALVSMGLIKHVMRGPMLAQILSTFGLALLLRYSAFYVFQSDFRTLPESSLSDTINMAGVFVSPPASSPGCSRSACTSCSRAPRSAAACSPSPRTAAQRCSWASGPTACRRWPGVCRPRA